MLLYLIFCSLKMKTPLILALYIAFLTMSIIFYTLSTNLSPIHSFHMLYFWLSNFENNKTIL